MQAYFFSSENVLENVPHSLPHCLKSVILEGDFLKNLIIQITWNSFSH